MMARFLTERNHSKSDPFAQFGRIACRIDQLGLQVGLVVSSQPRVKKARYTRNAFTGDPVDSNRVSDVEGTSTTALTELSDELLLRLLASGRADALSALYDRFGRLTHALAYRMLNDQAAAEDVVQEAFVAIWRNAPSFDSARGSARAWLFTTVRNRCVDVLRGTRRPSNVDDFLEIVPASDDVLGDVLRNLQEREVQAALAKLPDEQRATIDLAYFSGMTHAQIASHMRVPLGTVKGRMRLALEKLRDLLITSGGLEPAHEG